MCCSAVTKYKTFLKIFWCRNILPHYKAPTGAGKPGGVAVEEGGAGGWKVHLAQDNKSCLQRPSRTFSYSYTAQQYSYTTLLPLYTSYFLLLTVTISLYTMSTNIGPSYLSMVWLQGYNEIKWAKKLLKATEIQISDIYNCNRTVRQTHMKWYWGTYYSQYRTGHTTHAV